MAPDGVASVFLRLLAERAAGDPAYLAWVVQTHAEAEGQATIAVLTHLGVAESSATDFLVSLRPAGERFSEMLKAICARFGAHESTLLAVLREVEVLEAFRASTGSASGPGAAEAGMLMAARMREQTSEPRREHESAETDRDGAHSAEAGNDAR